MKILSHVFVLCMLFCGIAQAKTLDKVVAVVQGKAILLSDVQSLRTQVQGSDLLRGFYNIEGGITDQSILNRLVEDQIVRTRLKDLGTEITGDTVNKEIESIAKKNRLSSAQLKGVLKKQGVDFDNYFDALKSQIERRVIFNREISSAGSTLTEEELKAVYRTKAPTEFKVSIIVDTVSPKNKALMDEIAAKYKAKKLEIAKLKESPNYVDLGWVKTDEVADQFKKDMFKAKAGDSIGPVKKDGKYQLLLVEDTRKGTDEQFQKVKDEFRGSVEDLDTDKKFKTWFEKEKNEYEVTINPL